jgi:uncharacterized OB-fold protein
MLLEPATDDQTGPRLRGARCGQCGRHAYPVPPLCPACRSGDLHEVALSAEGTLYSFTVIHVGPAGAEVPYTLGYVDLPEDVRVLARIEGSAADLAPDSSVTLRAAEPTVGMPTAQVATIVAGAVHA